MKSGLLTDTRFRKAIIMVIPIAIILAFLTYLWFTDNLEYDRDLEADHFRETGLYWEDIEHGRVNT